MKSTPGEPIEVLVVDDSAVTRQLMTAILSKEADLRVTTASDPLVAMSRMRRTRPDVILLDLEMPRMDGLTFLKRLMASDPVPVVVCSGFAEPGTRRAMRALEAGAVDVALKPRVRADGTVEEGAVALLESIRAAAQAKVRITVSRTTLTAIPIQPAPEHPRRPPPPPVEGAGRAADDWIVAMGASTGGTEALRDILRALPATAPGIVVVQHMPEGFTAAFAQRLDEMCAIEVREARHEDRVTPGLALIAPGNRHLRIARRGASYLVELDDGPPVCRHRPSVDVLFFSVAKAARERAAGIILTGMGSDGAEGLRAMRHAGAATFAQDEASCVVFGMPREAIVLGAARTVLPLSAMASAIVGSRPRFASGRIDRPG
jgi:two-component system, chemotaxis family, protein-glutamate methylesterase/glutaminase